VNPGVMRTLSVVVLSVLTGGLAMPVFATASEACGFSTTVRWHELSVTKEQTQMFLSLVVNIEALSFSAERAEAWFSNGFDEIVLCQYRIGARAPCDADLLTVDFVKMGGQWAGGSVEKMICVN
jgi:hypothetical protein